MNNNPETFRIDTTGGNGAGNDPHTTVEEYIAPAKTSAQIKAERAAEAAAKAKAEAEEAARVAAEKEAARKAAEEARIAAEEQKKHKQSVEDALRHFDDSNRAAEEKAARRAQRVAQKEARAKLEAQLQAEAQASAMTPHERKKLEKKAAKGDEVARAQILAADAVAANIQKKLEEFDEGKYVPETPAEETAEATDKTMLFEPAAATEAAAPELDKKERKALEKDLLDVRKDEKYFEKKKEQLLGELEKYGVSAAVLSKNDRAFEDGLKELSPKKAEKAQAARDELIAVENELADLAEEAKTYTDQLGIIEGESPKKKRGKKVVAAIISLILVLAILVGVFVYRKLNLVGSNVDDYKGTEEILENDIDASAIDSITDASSLTALMKAWYLNGGEAMHSKNVRNILLIGIDSDSKLSDSMMVLSVNRLEKTLSLVSFYRDSYTYMETAEGASAFAKMNAAYYYGGAEMVQDVIEKDYKIQIDDYALVGYDSFPKMIDALGGVDVKVTKKEADYLNKTWKKWTRTGKKIQFEAGTMHMDGEHALMFSRIRKLDSDINRTERQRRVITAIMTQFKSASLSQVNAAMNAILPEIKTSMKKSQMLDLASDAVTQGWLKYPMTQAVMPPVEYCEEGYAGDQWIWICDYEGAAYELQNMLYGQSNITLAADRKNALDFSNGRTMTTTRGQYAGNYTYTTRAAQTAANSGGSSGGSGSGGSYYTTSYQTTAAETTNGGWGWQTTTQSQQTTASGQNNPWWWANNRTTTAAPTTATAE